MNLSTIILIALGLAMDCFAVSVASGFAFKDLRIKHAIRMAIFFGGFQLLMPIIGWFAGSNLRPYIMGYDHWVAFALLAGIGGKMAYESRKIEGEKFDPTKFPILAALAVATSIDALAVGLSLSFIQVPIALPACIIGAVSFIMTMLGIAAGKRFGHLFESKLELAGGLVLIGIGLKILYQHLTGA